MASTAELLADGDRSLRELLDRADTVPLDVAVAIALRAVHAVHVAHGQYAPRYGRLSLGATRLDVSGAVRIDWQSDGDDVFVVHDAKLDRRSDVLVLGLMLHCLSTTGRSDGELPAGLVGIIAKATASQPMDRYQTAIAMHGALERFAQSAKLATHDGVIGEFVAKHLGVPEVGAPAIDAPAIAIAAAAAVAVTIPAPTPLVSVPVIAARPVAAPAAAPMPSRATAVAVLAVPIPAPPSRAMSSGVPIEVVDASRAVTARIPVPTSFNKTGRIPMLPVIAPVESRVRPRTVQIPARGTSPNPLLAPHEVMLADGTKDNPCDDGWELPEADPRAEPPEPADVYELDESDLEAPEVWPD